VASGDPFASCLVIGAHADDCEFACGGTVAKWTATGTTARLCVLTDGSRGSHDPLRDRDELVRTRREEQRCGAAALGVSDVDFLEFVDGELRESEEAIEAVVRIIRGSRPDVVLAHDPWRRYMLHPDHRAAGEIACKAVFRAAEPRFYVALAAEQLLPFRPRELWLFSADEPNHVEDTSASHERKVNAVLEHHSQYWSFRIDPEDAATRTAFEEEFSARAAAIGAGAGYAFGEEFRRIVL
jgi:LmbE family N-acetylglucosaminyl deacetylase